MEISDLVPYKELFQDICPANIETIFPLAQKCIAFSSNEAEVLRAVKISFEFGLKIIPINELEKEIFQLAVPAAKKLLRKNLEILENVNVVAQDCNMSHFHLLNVCTEIVSYLCGLFIQLSDFQKVSLSHVESLILNTTEILHVCFCHCSTSEQVYGANFSSVTKYLTSCFKKCCELLELLLNFVADKLTFDCKFDDSRDIRTLSEILHFLSKFGIVLMNLDVKTMAKVWKTHIFLVEKYFLYIKDFDAGGTVNCLCETIFSSIGNAGFGTKEDQDWNKKIKLACFNLKLIIKFCEIFGSSLANCEKSLLDVLFTLCRCSILLSEEEKFPKTINKDLLKQLSLGMDPLLSCLIADEKIIKECAAISNDFDCFKYNSNIFSIFCCLVLKKLIHHDASIRNLWFNDKENILNWLFLCVSSDQYITCRMKPMSDVLVGGKQKKVIDLYQYILITLSAFVMTSTSKEFCIVEKTLIRNIMQPQPLCALLAIDVWCLLARFSDSNLCLNQVFKLRKIFQGFQYNTSRVEKWYLMLLIQRLVLLLTQTQKEMFIKSFQFSFPSKLWKINSICNGDNDFNLYLMHDLNNSFVCEIEKFLCKENDFVPAHVNVEMPFLEDVNIMKQKFEKQIVKLWRFNGAALPCFCKNNFFKIACLLTVQALPFLSSENTLLIISKIKKLLSSQSTIIKLYFTRILDALSVITFPSDAFRRDNIETVADLFGALLSSEKILIKQKALENFYNFSHVTNHTEIITLSVRHSPSLKIDVTNYFQKKISIETNLDLNEYISKLCKNYFRHVCQVDRDVRDKENESAKIEDFNGEKISKSVQGTIERWEKDGQSLIQFAQHLTSSQKREIKNLCSSVLSVVQ